MCRTAVIILISLVGMSGVAAGETFYVTDELRLTMHKAPDTSDKPFRTLVSGDSMEVLERSRYYARVRLADGTEGWVKLAYLISEPPAAARIRTVEAERDRAQAKLKTLESSLATRESRVSALEQEMAERQAGIEADRQELARLRDENESLRRSLARYGSSIPVSWAAIALLVVAVAGFVAAWWWIDRRSRLRHGGFRIY